MADLDYTWPDTMKTNIDTCARLPQPGKWIVTQDYIRGELCYMVEHSETGERKGTFDWQARAQEFADELNKEDEHETV